MVRVVGQQQAEDVGMQRRLRVRIQRDKVFMPVLRLVRHGFRLSYYRNLTESYAGNFEFLVDAASPLVNVPQVALLLLEMHDGGGGVHGAYLAVFQAMNGYGYRDSLLSLACSPCRHSGDFDLGKAWNLASDVGLRFPRGKVTTMTLKNTRSRTPETAPAAVEKALAPHDTRRTNKVGGILNVRVVATALTHATGQLDAIATTERLIT